MCGGFTCSKNSLIALNVLYVVVAITLISVAAYARLASIVPSTTLVSVIIACGVFLLLISIVGIVAASKHHQVLLFFYMIILFLIFIIQFSVACACLAMNESQQNALAQKGWSIASPALRYKAESTFHCCGYEGIEESRNCSSIKNTNGSQCCPKDNPLCCDSKSPSNATESSEDIALSGICKCDECNGPLQRAIGDGLSTVGGIGLFFSFTEIVVDSGRVIGFFIAKQYRHQIDPRANIQSLLH